MSYVCAPFLFPTENHYHLESISMSNENKKKSSQQWHGGKGSSQRKTDNQKFSDNWDAIFSKPKDDNPKEEINNDK